jgi:hypothetical protein
VEHSRVRVRPLVVELSLSHHLDVFIGVAPGQRLVQRKVHGLEQLSVVVKSNAKPAPHEHIRHQLLVISLGKVLPCLYLHCVEHGSRLVSFTHPCAAVEVPIGGGGLGVLLETRSTMIDSDVRPEHNARVGISGEGIDKKSRHVMMCII